MIFKFQLIWALSALLFTLLCQQTLAKLLTSADDSINNLYEYLLQREYAGPVVFPNLQVERKAQRSPSLRLRFGRRNDPMMNNIKKRWFGDVDQKPIRSPSLRLRFGRRSDPSMPLHSSFDALINNFNDAENVNDMDYNDMYDDGNNGEVRDIDSSLRKTRRPGRIEHSVPAIYSYIDENALRPCSDQYLNSLMNAQKMQNMLLAMHPYNVDTTAALSAEDSTNEFKRVVRKPGPLRLRWGRSIGGQSAAQMVEKQAEEKKSVLPNALNDEKSPQAAETQNDHNDMYEYEDKSTVRSTISPVGLFMNHLVRGRGSGRGRHNLLYEGEENSYIDENALRPCSDEYLNSLMNAQKMQNMLLAMHQYDVDTTAALSAEDSTNEFKRVVRKPGPLRLRWGRSIGGQSAAQMVEKQAEEKNSVSPNILNDEKSPNSAETQNDHNGADDGDKRVVRTTVRKPWMRVSRSVSDEGEENSYIDEKSVSPNALNDEKSPQAAETRNNHVKK